MNQVITALALASTLLGTGCKSKDEHASRAEKAIASAGAASKAEPPTLEITAKQVVLADMLAPNKTYADNGLGLKADAGKTFVCVEHAIKNAGTKPAVVMAKQTLVDATGAKTEMSEKAVGKLREGWKSIVTLDPIAPGATREGYACFLVPTAAAGGKLALSYDDATGYGREQGPWQKTIELPAAVQAAPL